MTASTIHDPQKVLDFIIRHKIEHDGNSPTVAEVCTACQISSKSTAHSILMKLQAQGRLRLSRQIAVVGGRWLPPGEVGP